MKYIKNYLLYMLMITSAESFSQEKKASQSADVEDIKWISFLDAVALNKIQPKKMIIDVYTDWCGWCKQMDKTTFKNKDVVSYINKYFYAVKFDAESKDTIKFDDKIFVSTDVNNKKAPHQMAVALLNGKLGYPTAVYLDEKLNIIAPVPGYQTAKTIEPMLKFSAEEKYKTEKWEDYSQNFKGSFKE